MERDARGTRQSILDAATTEFAAFGIAGSRVDRIAREAGVNKSLIYHHFGSKDALFDRVFETHVIRNISAAPLDAEHLPEWAGGIYDYYRRDSALVRLLTWARLERTPDGDLFAPYDGVDRTIYLRLGDAQRAGILIADYDPLDMFSLVIAMAGTWAQAAITVAEGPGDSPADRDRRRAALVAAVRRAFCVP